MSRDDPQLKLRLPQHLKDMVEQAAKNHSRSINAELVYRIEQSFTGISDQKDLIISAQQKLLKDTLARLDEIIARHDPDYNPDDKSSSDTP